MRSFLLALPLVALAPSARANSALWFDPDLGCGRVEVYARTARVADLPGCIGTLPANAPEVERALGEAKRALVEAAARLERDSVDGVDALLDQAQRRMATTPPPNAELPDRFATAAPLYLRAGAALRARRRLAPRLAAIRGAWRASADAALAMTSRERDGGPRASVRLATACIDALGAARTDGVDLATEVEIEKGRTMRLDAALADCDAARAAAQPLARAEAIAEQSRREEWRRALRGDRLKVFDTHPGALPECDTPSATPKTAAKSATWRYTGASSREVFRFSGNRLKGSEQQPR